MVRGSRPDRIKNALAGMRSYGSRRVRDGHVLIPEFGVPGDLERDFYSLLGHISPYVVCEFCYLPQAALSVKEISFHVCLDEFQLQYQQVFITLKNKPAFGKKFQWAGHPGPDSW